MSVPNSQKAVFNLDCRECERLAVFLDEVGEEYPEYHARPVAPFGDKKARLLIVGLAPGMHGANATGRPFTGDHAGILLYESLHKYGFSNQAQAVSRDDGLQLTNCRITNAVKCLPPQNKPTGGEINTCNRYLKNELNTLNNGSLILALGTIAHNAVLKALGLKMSSFKFGHARLHDVGNNLQLLDSYHCSRYN
ncbi:MAG: uracil-DNA glycosylase, partial [Gammaproteobacteria bacterium]|nr:uracil-DNA glycosylase [Gammaproteobacteria bacterium]